MLGLRNWRLDTVDEKFYDLHFDANVKGLFFTVQKGLPLMSDGGSVILTGWIADVKGFPSISVYSATKAAIRSFARTWTNELKDRRNRVNTISPGHIDTPIFDTWQQGEGLTKMKDDLAKNVPLGRLGDPDEIAKAVSFLASDEASYVAESSFTSMAAWPRSDEEPMSEQSLFLFRSRPREINASQELTRRI